MIPTESAITLRILKERSWIVPQLMQIRARRVFKSANADLIRALEKTVNKNPITTKHV